MTAGTPVFPQDEGPAGLYIHVPFCKARCSYCGFVSNLYRSDLEVSYIRSAIKEIELQARTFREATGRQTQCDSIYFGGGTPSLLAAGSIRRLLDACRKQFELLDSLEVTLEINPGTLTPSEILEYRRMGVNRASLGIQSLADSELAAMGRLHSAAEAFSAYRDLRSVGFDNVSVDLIAGFPGQTLASLRESLRSILDLAPEHLSVYLLEIKSGTKLAELIASGVVLPLDEDLAADMYDEICTVTAKAGYDHYEISNFALPGRFSRHNMKYWNDEIFLGFGPGGHGMTGHYRYANVESLDRYEQALDAGSLPVETVTEMTPETRFKDALIMGLRLVKGVDLDLIGRRYGVDARAFVLETVGDLQSGGLLEMTGHMLWLTPKGRLLSNIVFSRWV